VGYDAQGRYVDADAWIVNERETPLEVKITRTVTPDGISHFKVSVQNTQNIAITSVVFFAGDKKLHAWPKPPYAIEIPNDRLQGVDYVRVTATNADGLEATDLLFMDGARYMEQVEINAVELPVSVVDAAGNPVADLKREEFDIFEDGKPQKIEDFGFSSDLPLSLGVLVDHSGSMKERIQDARQAAIKFFEQIVGPRDRAFFGGFSWDASKISPLVGDVASLRMQVDTMPEAEGGTALYDAIVSGLYRFRTVPGRKALIIVSDGEDTVSRIPYEEMLTYVRASRVPLYFIGVGMSFVDRAASSKMRGLAAETGGVTYFIKNVESLGETYKQLENELRMQYLITYYTQSSKGDRKYRTVEVKTKRPELKVRTIRGFIP
ncbi:MAG TPA: VWA domain-containing protein, partial [Thermoanaerobaculia bacterium]